MAHWHLAQISAGERARFEASDVVQGARLLHDEGGRDVFRGFVLALDDILPTASDQAMLIDLVRSEGLGLSVKTSL